MNHTDTPLSPAQYRKHVEVQEFATLTPARTLIKVLHYQTRYTEQGEVEHHILDARALAVRIVREFGGEYRIDTHGVSAVFANEDTAREVVKAITDHLTPRVAQRGPEISIEL